MDNLNRRNAFGHMGLLAASAAMIPGFNGTAKGSEGKGNMEGDQAFSIIISTANKRVVATARGGAVVAEGVAGKDDSSVFQKAIDSLCPHGGEIRIARGRYRFSKTVTVDLPVTITGEGFSTTLVTPPDDYLFNVTTTARSPLRHNCNDIKNEIDATVTGVTLQMFAVDGENAGKGIFMDKIMDCLFQNLWMYNIHRGSALYLGDVVMECSFTNIHLNSTGCKNPAAPSIFLTSKKNNNLRFTRIYTILPFGQGLRVHGGTIVTFNDCFWHGTFPVDTDKNQRLLPRDWKKTDLSAPNIKWDTEELIYVQNVGWKYDKGLTFSRPRITNAHPSCCQMVVENGEVTVLDGIIGSGGGAEAVIRAEKGARMRIQGNHFCGFPGYTPNLLQCNGGEVIFRDNVVDGKNKHVTLTAAKRSLISGNRFTNQTQGASLRIMDHGATGCEHIIVSENIFQDKASSAIEIGKLSGKTLTLRDNIFAGKYSGEPVVKQS